jgi:hypothetical protein
MGGLSLFCLGFLFFVRAQEYPIGNSAFNSALIYRGFRYLIVAFGVEFNSLKGGE